MQPYRYLPILGKQLLGWKVGMSVAATVADFISIAAWATSLTDIPGSKLVLASLAVRAAASVSASNQLSFSTLS